MDAWQTRYGGAVAFVCVCVAGPHFARKFASELRLKHCFNTWISEEEDMPRWGQLGCSGFIVIDGDDKVVCDKSAAYLEVKDNAYSHVEKILQALLPAQQPTMKKTKISSCGKEENAAGCTHCAKVRFDAEREEEEEEEGKSVPGKGTHEHDLSSSSSIVVEPAKVASVNVDVLDEEHEACEKQLALLRLLTTEKLNKSKINTKNDGKQEEESIEAALNGLIEVYESHFKHEEELLDKYLYADVTPSSSSAKGGGFSATRNARTSHFADHQSMISGIRLLLHNVSSFDTFAAAKLQKDFERHATLYDGGYAPSLSAAMMNT